MEQLIWFLGRFHVLVLHLPLGILSLAVAFELLGRLERFRVLRGSVPALWIAGAVTAIATVILGVMHASEDAFVGVPAARAHGLAGAALCLAACGVAFLRPRLQPANLRLWSAPIALTVALMFLTGHLGGKLTHGDTFLVQYAPGPLRALAGLPADAGPRPKPTSPDSADVFLDVVQPALQRRCGTCHNGSKRSGGLSIASYEDLMKGGEQGPVVKAGDPEGSDLIRRVKLAPSSEDYMPRDGKPHLDPQEILAIEWWISSGAPRSASVASLTPTPEASAAIATMLGLSVVPTSVATTAADGEEDTLPTVPEADTATIGRLMAAGFVVRRSHQGSNLLELDYTGRPPLGPEALADLSRVSRNILRLNLRQARLTDGSLKTLATFPHLRQLRLEHNDITDAGVLELAALPELRVLNLTGTHVTDRGLEALAHLPSLRKLYVWETAVTAAGAARVAATRQELALFRSLRAREVPATVEVIPPDF